MDVSISSCNVPDNAQDEAKLFVFSYGFCSLNMSSFSVLFSSSFNFEKAILSISFKSIIKSKGALSSIPSAYTQLLHKANILSA
ncbi:MAG: hypothetical protein LBU14_00090 [Candidatus Peribacteria bacterium]|nr:hypothetical protein [Candidatus Peribacteria bacterium]